MAIDPTRTITLRRRYTNDFKRRWKVIQRLVRESLVVNDALRQRSNPSSFTFQASPLTPSPSVTQTQQQDIDRFMLWLEDAINQEVVGTLPGQNINGTQRRDDWMVAYITSAYLAGLNRADGDLKRQGVRGIPDATAATLRQPIHQQEIDRFIARYYSDLGGIKTAVLTQVRRILDDALAQGLSPQDTYELIADRLQKIGNTRSDVLVQDAVIRTVNVAILARLASFGITQVEAQVEFRATRNTDGSIEKNVCSRCRELDGRVFTLQEARGVIPVHPRCRCRWVAIVDDVNEVTETPLASQFFAQVDWDIVDTRVKGAKQLFKQGATFQDIYEVMVNE